MSNVIVPHQHIYPSMFPLNLDLSNFIDVLCMFYDDFSLDFFPCATNLFITFLVRIRICSSTQIELLSHFSGLTLIE